MPVRDLLSAASTQGAAPADPYFYDVSLLLNGDGTNGAQNNTFLDSSSNAFTITRNGNTTQGSFSPYGTLWSNYFNGSSSLRGGSSISTGAGDYTVECWANMPSPGSNTNGNIFITIGDEQTGTGCCFYQYNNSVRMYGAVASGAPRMSLSYTFSPNVWYHIAFVRSGITTTAYVNGTSIGTATVSGVGFAFSGNPYVSEILDTGNFYKGDACYISNLRVTQSALYTSNFTPSATPLTAISGVQFLTSQSNRFIDNSSNNITLTASGSPSVQRFSPFNPTAPYNTATIGGSGYFDGSGGLNITSGVSGKFQPGSAFTFEAWMYIPSVGGAYYELFGVGGSTVDWNAGTGLTYAAGAYASGGTNYMGWQWNNGGGTNNIAGVCPLNQWFHFAVGYGGGTTRVWINGVSVGTSGNGYTVTSYTKASVGAAQDGTTNPFYGYIEDARFVAGTDIYGVGNSTITVPTAPLTAVSGTQLLTSMTNAGIPDLAMQNDLQTVGSAQVNTSVVKYGTGSLYFNAAPSYLLSNAPSSNLYAFGTGDFTVEFWLYLNSVSGVIVLFDTRNSSEPNCPVLYMSSGTLLFYVGGADRASGGSLSTNTWYHVALCRSGTSTRLFVNGVQPNATYTDTNNYICQTNRPAIGANGYVSGGGVGLYPLNGYIDDLRITNGYARYTANFTPPTAALPTY